MEHFSQSPGFELGERRAGLRRPVMMGWPLLAHSAECFLGGRWCDLDLKIPISSNRRLTYGIRVENAKMPRPLIFDRHMEVAIIEAQKPSSTILLGGRTLFATTGALDLEKNPPCNVEDNLCAVHLVIEAWFRGY